MIHIGKQRRALFITGTWKWNAWVRDSTAWMERKLPWLLHWSFPDIPKGKADG